MVCELLRLDPVTYFTETDPEANAIRDAAATVIAENRRAEAEEAKRKSKK